MLLNEAVSATSSKILFDLIHKMLPSRRRFYNLSYQICPSQHTITNDLTNLIIYQSIIIYKRIFIRKLCENTISLSNL